MQSPLVIPAKRSAERESSGKRQHLGWIPASANRSANDELMIRRGNDEAGSAAYPRYSSAERAIADADFPRTDARVYILASRKDGSILCRRHVVSS